MIRSQAMLIAIGIGWDGRRHIRGVELANRERRGGWKDFLVSGSQAEGAAAPMRFIPK